MKSVDELALYWEHESAPLRAVIERLDAARVVYLCSQDGAVVASFDDRSARRAMLAQCSLDRPVPMSLAHRAPDVVAPTMSRVNVLELMGARGLSQLAVIDEQRRLTAVHLLDRVVGVARPPVRAVIMAGGRGTRLYPLTARTPKPMLPVAGRPILERLVLHLTGFGIEQIFLAINYLGTTIEEHFGDGSRFGCRIEYLREKIPLGTGGALSLLPEDRSLTTLMLNGDLVTQIDVRALLAAHAESESVATMGVRRYQVSVPYGVVDVADRRIQAFREKPQLDYRVNAGVYVFSSDALAMIPKEREYPITALFEECLARGLPLGAHLIEEEWIDVGELESLLRARGGIG